MNANGDPYPTFVFEVGVSECVGSLHNLAPEYFVARTTIRAYLAIKIREKHADGTFAALALLYLRSNVPNTTPVQAISFGTAPIHGNAVNSMPAIIRPLISGFHGPAPQLCNVRGLRAFQINLSIAELYHGVPAGAVPSGLPVSLQIDLFDVQRVVY